MNDFAQLRAALDNATSTIPVFFRDDDAGWAPEQLLALCRTFGERAPLDLAVIPMAISDRHADELQALPGPLGFHQHGLLHRNHQVDGRKCEFSDDRPFEQILADVANGRSRMVSLFGSRADRIFTPPWNRCGRITATALLAEGFKVLSRDRSAGRFDVDGLVELPVTVDWERARSALDAALAVAVTTPPLGIMLHHEVLSRADLGVIDRLLDLLTAHPNVRLSPMRDLARVELAA